jgi:hypothetical protein
VTRRTRRYNWITNQLLHVMAFRPEYFTEQARSWGYGPLYRRHRISKGRGQYRQIFMPNRPLHWVQRCLLDLLLRPLLDDLPACVTGCRRGQSIFGNALAHLGQQFVLNIDLQDFFPSIDVNQIVPALLALREFRISPGETEASAVSKGRVDWNQELAVLVARLVTRRSRLPQGAPTSPAVANLVFARYDRRLLDALGPEVVYTRYVDDLTFSISRRASQDLGFREPDQFQDFVRWRLTTVLGHSPFRVNEGKVHQSTLAQGHEITGLRVGAATIDLKRRARRYVRLLTIKLRKHPLAVLARMPFVVAEIHAQTRPRPQDGRHQRLGRRVSTERLAQLLVQRFLPDLQAEIPRTEEANSASGGIGWASIPPDERWRLVERLLNYLWRRQARASFGTDPHEVIIHDAQNQAICRLTSRNRLDFFLLPQREAIGCTELWHHARGLVAALNVRGGDFCFARIREQRRHLKDALDSVELARVGDELPPAGPSLATESIDLTRRQQIQTLAPRVRELVTDFRGYIVPEGQVPHERWMHLDTLIQVADNPETLRTWFQAARYLTVLDLPRVPPHRPGDSPGGIINVLGLVRVAADRLDGRRSHVYQVEQDFLRQPINRVTRPRECQEVQLRILNRLQDLFTRSLEQRVQVGAEAWEQELEKNVWVDPLNQRLRKAVDRFVELHDALTTQSDERRGEFQYATLDSLAKYRSELALPRAEGTSQQRWNDLFGWGKKVIGVTSEHFEERLGEDGKPMPKEKRLHLFKKELEGHAKALDVIYGLRNRAAHDYEPKYWKDWQDIQVDIAARLGKRFDRQDGKPPASLFAPNTLELTAEEATEARLALLEDFSYGLDKVIKKQPARG